MSITQWVKQQALTLESALCWEQIRDQGKMSMPWYVWARWRAWEKESSSGWCSQAWQLDCCPVWGSGCGLWGQPGLVGNPHSHLGGLGDPGGLSECHLLCKGLWGFNEILCRMFSTNSHITNSAVLCDNLQAKTETPPTSRANLLGIHAVGKLCAPSLPRARDLNLHHTT